MTTAPAPRAGCPVQLTTFIGRERELAAVDDLLQSARLVTLTGVGGAGKTRLAAEVAARVTPRFEASAWVDLASLSDPALVAELVAATLGYREEGGRSAVQTMVHRLCECDTFVILDNCEHLDRKSTRLNSSHLVISYAVFCLKKKKNTKREIISRACMN